MREKIVNEWNRAAQTEVGAFPFEAESRNFVDRVILESLDDLKGKNILDVGMEIFLTKWQIRGQGFWV